MLATMRRTSAVLVLAAGLALCAAAPAFAQETTGSPGAGTGSTAAGSGSAAVTTGPSGALTLGTTATTGFTGATGGGSSPSSLDEEPLPSTGGGDVAFAVGGLLAAGGLGLRWAVARRG